MKIIRCREGVYINGKPSLRKRTYIVLNLNDYNERDLFNKLSHFMFDRMDFVSVKNFIKDV